MNEYVDYALEMTQKVLAIDSPTGMTRKAAEFVLGVYEELGFKALMTVKGSVLADLGGSDPHGGRMLAAHIDTLGGMVCEIKKDGRLKLSPLGGMNPNNGEAENCRIVTRFNGVYTGTLQLKNASLHVNNDYNTTTRSWDEVEVVIDEPVSSADDVKKLGIMAGDFVCFDPRTTITASGYIKSRFLDDKLSVGILLAHAKYLRDKGIVPKMHLYNYITVYEEVGHGGASVPVCVDEIISVDMGCVGEGLSCTERQVSICAKDSHSPYNYDVVTGLVAAARDNNIDFAVDVYPRYGSDVDVSLKAGHEVRHGLIGAGVYASHGYERSHRDGVENTLRLLTVYCR